MVTAVTGNTMLDTGQEGAYLRAGTYQAAGACLHRILAKVSHSSAMLASINTNFVD